MVDGCLSQPFFSRDSQGGVVGTSRSLSNNKTIENTGVLYIDDYYKKISSSANNNNNPDADIREVDNNNDNDSNNNDQEDMEGKQEHSNEDQKLKDFT